MPYRVEIRKKRGAAKFSHKRYPGFRYKRTGKYTYHWEATVSETDLSVYRSRANQDGFQLKATPLEFVRSSDYRKVFLSNVPGPYRCRYCNRRLEPEELVVDHIVPVAAAAKSHLARRLIERFGAAGVNSVVNLAPACRSCNARKSSKGGLWVLRGVLGRYPVYWATLYGFTGLIALSIVTFSLWAVLDPAGVCVCINEVLCGPQGDAVVWPMIVQAS